MTITVQILRGVFEQVNKDCAEKSEPVVPFSNVDFYAEQIQNLYELPYVEARGLAVRLALELE